MLTDRNFTLAEIAEVLGKNPQTLRTHINRGYATALHSGTGKATGKHARFSFHTVMEFAVAYHLEALGVRLESGFRYATGFAHVGHGAVPGLPGERAPGFPYHTKHGRTLVAVHGDRMAIALWDNGKTNPYVALRSQLGRPAAMIVFDATQVFFDVCKRLGVDAYDALNAEYREEAE
ncbi:hypothetical protein [Tropicimonas isoalkanivorans]|uniref:Helix-turn-helix domain-containing protein n=1 Tax=Tropicimonas isoalkanivorans TaxID=441112 RepID=A0A1I1LYJ2_9RHOB|nr:hypothetical protein [Tropicimonas isoalkanivorans]SFC77552.1 hypothetical protein SAMN04488094_10954 [Tropicimonas isoalkanivorans]